MAKRAPQPDSSDQPAFEEALQELEQIVRDLEEGQIGLNEALQRYEQGVKLLRRCYDLLQGAERRIELLSGVDAEGNPVTQPFDDQSTLSLEEKAQNRSRYRSAPENTSSGGSPEPGSDQGNMDASGGLL